MSPTPTPPHLHPQTDGRGAWDKLDPYGDARNYTITTPGIYRLSKGRVERVRG